MTFVEVCFFEIASIKVFFKEFEKSVFVISFEHLSFFEDEHSVADFVFFTE